MVAEYLGVRTLFTSFRQYDVCTRVNEQAKIFDFQTENVSLVM